MADFETTELASVSIDTTTDHWEALYQDWQGEVAQAIVDQFGERVATIHVERIPDEGTPNNAIFVVYADLYPEEV